MKGFTIVIVGALLLLAFVKFQQTTSKEGSLAISGMSMKRVGEKIVFRVRVKILKPIAGVLYMGLYRGEEEAQRIGHGTAVKGTTGNAPEIIGEVLADTPGLSEMHIRIVALTEDYRYTQDYVAWYPFSVIGRITSFVA